MRLNLQSFLPHFAIVATAREHDNVRARELCAGVRAGEIVIFDKAYVDFRHLADLGMREVFWVTRAKENLEYRVVRRFQPGRDGHILGSPSTRKGLPRARTAFTAAAAGMTGTRWAAPGTAGQHSAAVSPRNSVTSASASERFWLQVNHEMECCGGVGRSQSSNLRINVLRFFGSSCVVSMVRRFGGSRVRGFEGSAVRQRKGGNLRASKVHHAKH